MKRRITKVLAAGLIAGLLAGCSAQTPAVKPGPETEQAEAEKPETDSSVEPETTEETAVSVETPASGETAASAETAASGETAAESAAAVDYTTGTPWLCSFLESNVTADTPKPDLRDDFYLACNLEGILARQIPEGHNKCGTLDDVSLQLDDDIQALFTGNTTAESHDAQMALNLYALYTDWESRNALGVQPLKERVDKVESIDSIDALTEYLVKTPVEEQLSTLFSVGHTPSFEDSSVNILVIGESDLFLKDSAEYRELTDYGAVIKKAYSEYADKLLQKLGYSPEEAAQKIENCLTFESRLAPDIPSREETRKPDYMSRINNHYTRRQVAEAQGDLPILSTFEDNIGYPQADDYLLTLPAWLNTLKSLYTQENLTQIKDYLIVRGIISCAHLLDRECYEWSVECQNTIQGSSGILPDETVFSGTVSNTLDWPVARLYVEKYLSPDDKDRVSDLVDDILEEYRGIIQEAEFLSEETRAAAIEKLASIQKQVLWPDDWEKYNCKGLEIPSPDEGGTLPEADLAITRYNSAKTLKEFTEPVDKDKWFVSPTFCNCSYDPSTNTISIFGSFARGDVYNSSMSDEELYARLGMVIGHEISHAFDSTGAQFDKDGNMRQWWTQEDWAAFQERNDKLVAYIDKIHPWEGQDYRAGTKSGEVCAEMGGMKCMLRIAAKKEGFDYDKFFRSYVDLWQGKGTLNSVYSYINDEHPLPYLRVNCILQQYDEFLDLYGIGEGDGMYLAPEGRVNIW